MRNWAPVYLALGWIAVLAFVAIVIAPPLEAQSPWKPHPTRKPHPTATAVSTPTASASSTSSPTSSPRPTATATPTPSASPSPSPTSTTSTPTQTAPSATGFVQRSGTQLTLNGQPYRFVGFNIYNLNSVNDCNTSGNPEALLAELDSVQDASRSWFFARFAQGGWTRFDRTLAAAAANGQKVVVTLTNHWGDCEDGTSKSESWYQTGYKTNAWFGFASFRAYVQAIVTRYKNDPTILMWQMVNEAEASHTSLKAFAIDIGGLIKSIDANHLVSLGTIGSGQNGASGADYKALHAITQVDICEYHDYSAGAMPGDQWNGLSVRLQQCAELNKPLFVGETGILRSVGLTTRAQQLDAKMAAQFAAGVVGIQPWDWRLDSNYNYAPGDPALSVMGGY